LRVITVKIPDEKYELLKKACKIRGEGVATFIRRATLKELARLGLLPPEEATVLLPPYVVEVVLPSDVLAMLRERAEDKFGPGFASVHKAILEAVLDWLQREEMREAVGRAAP